MTYTNIEDPDEYSTMLHFIRVCTVCNGKSNLQKNEYNIFFKIYNMKHLICSMGYSKFVPSNQKEESISTQRVKNEEFVSIWRYVFS